MASPHSSSPNGSDEAPNVGKRRGGPRGLSKRPQGRYTITAIDLQDGAPTAPPKAAAAFRTLCGIVGRERVPITYPSWKTLTDEERDDLVTEIFASFELPQEAMHVLRRYALLVAGKAWKNFKSVLVTKFVNQGMTPFQKYGFITENVWERFVEMKTTEEFASQSAAHKTAQSKNTHPHRLGSTGYAGKITQWAREDAEAIQQEVEPPFASIMDPRARNWVRARSRPSTAGGVSFANAADEEVTQRMISLSAESSQGSFTSKREKERGVGWWWWAGQADLRLPNW